MQELIRETISHDLLERYINEWLSVSNTSHNWKRLHQILINMNDSISEAMGIDTSIYANNGTLAGNRVVTGNGKSLQFAGVAGFSVVSSTLISLTATQTLTFNSSATTTFNVNSLHLNINSNSGNAGDVIMADGAGTCSWQPVVGGGPSVNIYNANGALTSNRTLSGDDNELLFTNLTKFSIDNTDEINLIGTTSSINSTDFTIEATNPYLITGSTAASLAGSPLVALTSASGNFGFAAYALPTSLGVGDDGKILQYDHGTTSFVMATAAVDTNIYNTNGSLTGNRTVTGAGFTFAMTGLSGYTLTSATGNAQLTATAGNIGVTAGSDINITTGADLNLNVTGEIAISNAVAHDATPGAFAVFTDVGFGQLAYITAAELITATGAVTNNIYAGNGTLASNRTVSGGGLYSIAFNNTTASTFTSNGLTTIGSNVEIDLLSSTVDILTGTLGFKSTASVVSISALKSQGAWFTGGTTTTNKPHFLLETTGVNVSNNWNIEGTGLGINSESLFTGDLINCQVNSNKKFIVSATGTSYLGGAIQIAGSVNISTGNLTAGTANLSGITTNNGADTHFVSTGVFTVTTPRYSYLATKTFQPAAVAGTYSGFEFQSIINQTGTASGAVRAFFSNPTLTSTVNYRGFEAGSTFAPTSGTGTFWGFVFEATINQTGGASGITRGVYINPTLTAAADFRAIDVVAGRSTFAARVQFGKGANVASAATVTLGNDGNLFHITGTTNIDNITTTNWQAGSEIVLIFDDVLTVNDGTGNLQLAGNFTTSANDTMKLIYNGTSWFELSRSVN